jgi:hypothetical protein
LKRGLESLSESQGFALRVEVGLSAEGLGKYLAFVVGSEVRRGDHPVCAECEKQ